MKNLFENVPETDELEVENMITNEEALELAKLAIEHLSTEMKEDDKFPGADAYKKVMRIVVLSGANNKLIEEWQQGYEDLEEKFKTEKDAESFVSDLKVMLKETLESIEKAKEEAKKS